MATAAIAPPPGFTMDAPGAPPPPDGFQLDAPAPQPQPNVPAANATFAQTIGNAVGRVGESANKTVVGAIEGALHAGTGLAALPIGLGADLIGLGNKYLLNKDFDPAAFGKFAQDFWTYQAKSESGQANVGALGVPLQAASEAATAAGQFATRQASIQQPAGRGGSSGSPVAAGIGATVEQTVGMLPLLLLGELGRKMSGQVITNDDMANVAKNVATDAGKPESAPAVEQSLRATYEKTGIGPYTVAEEAAKNPSVQADLLDPAVDVPKGIQDQIPVPDTTGEPALDVSGPTVEEAQAGQPAEVPREAEPWEEPQAPISRSQDELLADPKIQGELRAMQGETGWAQKGGYMIRDASAVPEDEMLIGGGKGLGPVVGRTEWVPNADWWPGRPKGLTEAQTKIAIDKALAGEPLKAAEQRFVDYATQVADQSLKSREWAPTADDLHESELDGSRGFDVGMVGRASAIDEGKIEELAKIHEDDDHAFMLAVKEFLDDHDAKTAQGGKTGAGAQGETTEGSTPAQEVGAVPGVNAGTVDLNMGLNPVAAIKAIGDSYTPFVGVERPADPVRAGFVDSVQKLIAPAARGADAQTMSGIMRANLGELAHEREVALESLRKDAARFDKLPVADNIKFIDSMERGTPDPKFAAEAASLRALLDDRRAKVQALGGGALEDFDANYFPHMWKDPDAAQALYGRRPLEGSKAFLKARTIPFTVDGLRWRAYDADGDFLKSYDTEAQAKAAMPADGRIGAPLVPITTNPVELALLKVREMDKYIYGQRIFEEMKASNLARFVRFGGEAPEGWTKINDKIARVLQPNDGEGGGMILRGEYYAPDQAATLINNHLSPGLQGNAFYDAFRGIGNAMNQLQLGLSAFHVGFTTVDSVISKVALGIKQMSRGDILEGAGNVAVAPAQPFLNIYRGDRLLRAYLGKLDDPSIAPIVQAIQDAGGRVKMDDFYRNTTVNGFKQAIRNGDTWGATKAFLPTVLDRIGAPIFEDLVPRQKLGVFFDMAKDYLDHNPNADTATRRAELGKLWDSVDNRMGQLVYDNVFWNHALKDALMVSVRSVGWNLGTFRELGGGVLDIRNIVQREETGNLKPNAQGVMEPETKLAWKGLSDRTAYLIALPFVTGIIGSIMNYAMTGEPPRDPKDAYFPRSGRIRPDGSEDRVSLPTYMKDVYAYGNDASNFAQYGSDPTQTLKNKMHPLISTVSEMLNNEDFFGASIRNPADPAVQQIKDEANFLLHQIEPFSLRNYEQQAKERGVEPSVPDYLTSPSMVGVTPAPGYLTKSKQELESEAVSKLRDPLVRKFRQELKDGASPDEMVPEMLKSGLSRQDIKFVLRSSGDTPKPHRLKSFGQEAQP